MAGGKTQGWSLIVFGYNEVGALGRVLDGLLRVFPQLSHRSGEIIIVDDGSTDGMDKVAQQYAHENSMVKVIRHPVNRGIGAALRSGYHAASGENVCALPADGQFDPTELLPFSIIPPGEVISFYRRENLTYSPFRNILSLFNKRVNEYLLGLKLKDVNWVKVYKGNDLKSITLEVTSSLIESEICAKLHHLGRTFIEVESVYQKRETGRSKGASFKITRQAVADIGKLHRVIRRFRRST